MKPIYQLFKKKGAIATTSIENYYRSRFFSVFMNKFEIEGMTADQKRFFLTQMWETGTINAFILKGSKPTQLVLEDMETVENPNGILVLTPYAPFEYNIYNYPTKLTAVNIRGAKFIPADPMKIGKDCVIGFCHTSHMPIRYLVDFYVERLANIEKTIDTQIFTHKLPRLVICSPEDKERVDRIMKDIEAGNNTLFMDANDWQSIKNVLESGGNYIIDKLYDYKVALENELLTILGIDNAGIEKRERKIVDEVNANNAIINDGNDTFMTELKEFEKQVNEILGYPLKITSKELPVMAVSEEDKLEGGNNNDDDM